MSLRRPYSLSCLVSPHNPHRHPNYTFPIAKAEGIPQLIVNNSKHPKDHIKIKILLPLIKMTKIEVIQLARELNVPLEWTWSCYSDGENPCGQCSNCLKRIEAFKELGFSEDFLSS